MKTGMIVLGAAIGAGALYFLLKKPGAAGPKLLDASFALNGPEARYPSVRAITRAGDGVILDPGTVSMMAIVLNNGDAPGDAVVYLNVLANGVNISGNLATTTRITLQPGESRAMPTLSFQLPSNLAAGTRISAEAALHAGAQGGALPMSPTQTLASGLLGTIASPVVRNQNIGLVDAGFNVI